MFLLSCPETLGTITASTIARKLRKRRRKSRKSTPNRKNLPNPQLLRPGVQRLLLSARRDIERFKDA